QQRLKAHEGAYWAHVAVLEAQVAISSSNASACATNCRPRTSSNTWSLNAAPSSIARISCAIALRCAVQPSNLFDNAAYPASFVASPLASAAVEIFSVSDPSCPNGALICL